LILIVFLPGFGGRFLDSVSSTKCMKIDSHGTHLSLMLEGS
jgi:hypothetical protein